jgi:colicin import membrane protein
MISTGAKRDKAEQTTAVAWDIINTEAQAREKKTARLRKLREAQEAEAAAEAAANPPAPKKKAAAAKKKSAAPAKKPRAKAK